MMKFDKLLLLAIAVLIIASTASCSDDAGNEPVPVPESTVDTKPWNYNEHMDTSVAPGDDFFMYCVGKWWNDFDLGWYSYYGFCGNESQGYINKYAASMDSTTIKKLYADAAIVDNTTDAALEAIDKALQVTEGIETQEDAWKAIAKAMKLGYTPWFYLGLIPQSRIMNAYLGNINEKGKDSKSAINEEGQIENHSSMSYIRNHPERLDDFVPLKSLRTRATGNDMLDCIFAELGIDEEYATFDKELQKYYDHVRALTPEEIRDTLRYCILRDKCFASNEEYKAGKDKYSLYSYMKLELYDFVKYNMNYIQSYDYATHLNIETQKAEMKEFAEQVIDVFKTRVDSLDWMSGTTKAKAYEKLDKMIFNIGYPDKWIEEALPQLTGTSLVEDMMQIRAANFKGTMACVGKTSEEMSFNWMILCEDVSLLVDNAYYNPGDNSMTILPIYLMEPYYSKEYSDAFNYSTLASTLGHEMTHALDVNGSMFDAYGNYRNWWTVADKMEFKDRQQKLIDCINMLEIMPNELPNVFADGEMTLSENTADLGGFLIGLQAYVEKLKREGYYGEEMTKQERKFYQAYAEQWRAKYTPEYALRRRKDDVHSLAKERVNGTVMNTDRWYELFDVKFGNILYLTPETRARIW